MPAPGSATWHADILVAVHTEVLAQIDGGSGVGYIAIRDASDVLLASVDLDDPGGTVNGTTGQLTLDPDATPNAAASGTAAYGEVCDSDDKVLLALPAQAGSSPVANKLVLNSLAIVSGQPVSIVSATIG